MAPSVPTSVQELVAQAENFDFYVQQPLITWLRSAAVLRRQADTCEQEGDLKLAFLYTYRHLVLILNKISQYPGSEKAKHKLLIKQEKDRVVRNLTKLEQWKPHLKTQYEEELGALHARRKVVQQARASTSYSTVQESDEAQADVLDISEHRDLAANIARRELLRRTGRQFESSLNNDKERVSVMMQQARRLIDKPPSPDASPSPHTDIGQYPTVMRQETKYDYPSSPPLLPQTYDLPPRLPSKIHDGPALPAKKATTSSPVTFRSTAHTEAGEPLRNVILPATLQQKFLNLAHSNTARDLETCGILGASLAANTLIITHLIIPDQTSTSDTCDTTDTGDVALYEYCEAHDLISCGWIHTHPSQTCFLSSRDLHTSAAYQQMLPEAIAIVCAPRHNPSSGIFRLTNPPGLPAILKCTLPGLFHQHSETKLYTDATTPGHVIEESKLEFKVVDLRAA